MRNVYVILMVVAMAMVAIGCTESIRAKAFGGDMIMDLECDQKLVNVTWKEANTWLLTRPMMEVEETETYMFVEKSSYGLAEGTITIREHKCQ
jgi:hypothetical protein